jgi:formate dehydrogenase maturation protein FdhE
MAKKPKQQTNKREWVDPQVGIQPVQPQEPAQTTQEFMDEIASKMVESLGIPTYLPDYESPSYSSARIHMQAIKEASELPIPREDEARPCTLCESRRPIGKSYSRVYCTKVNVRYCKCSYCGHTWTQERK